MKQYFVYLLISSGGATYVGATVDLSRRLKQHNKQLSGGATYTGSKIAKGEIWKRAVYVENFPDWSSALQFEWKWKQLTRQITSGGSPSRRRMLALMKLMELPKPTKKAKQYTEWENYPNIIIEDDYISNQFKFNTQLKILYTVV